MAKGYSFRDTLTDIVNGAVLMFAVGAILSAVLPHLGAAFHVSKDTMGTIDPLWNGLFFGAFGAISAALTPAFQRGKDSEPAGEKERGAQVNIVIQKEHEPQKACNRWQDQVLAERTSQADKTTSINL
jgi:hypothetical protein